MITINHRERGDSPFPVGTIPAMYQIGDLCRVDEVFDLSAEITDRRKAQHLIRAVKKGNCNETLEQE